jgi:hypothetical protein
VKDPETERGRRSNLFDIFTTLGLQKDLLQGSGDTGGSGCYHVVSERIVEVLSAVWNTGFQIVRGEMLITSILQNRVAKGLR